MRVGILGLLQESNTFVAAKTTLTDFAADVLANGEEIRTRFQSAAHEIGGFFAGLEQQGIEAVPLLVARALPNGVIEAAAFDQLMELMFAQLEHCGTLDGLLVAPHGATVSEEFPDADGYWLTRVRRHFGPEMPIVGTIDPHANLTADMVAACDALIAYRTNPHIDQRERGIEAANLLVRILRGECRPTMCAVFPPLAISIDQQATEEEPCRSLARFAEEIRQLPGVLTASLVFGFPYADVTELGSSAIVATDGDRQLAERYATDLASEMWEARSYVSDRKDVQSAIDQALEVVGPVCLLDMGDNVGGGSPGDGTWIARALDERRVDRSLVCLCDAAAVGVATGAGIGHAIRLAVGGKHSLSGGPLTGQFNVVGLFAGRFGETGTTHGGFTSFDQGPSAVLLAESGLTLLVTSRRMVPFSLAQLRSCGLDPAAFRILVAEGVNAPIVAYREVCRTFIRVDTPGVTTADMTRLDFANRRRPLFPFERDCPWHITPPNKSVTRACW